MTNHNLQSSATRPDRQQSQRVVFLDRDGTLVHDPGYVYRLEDFRLLDYVTDGLLLIQELGYKLFVVTNQAGIAHKRFTLHQMHAFNELLVKTLAQIGVTIESVYFCPYHPNATLPEYRGDSSDRKPRPGMLLRAAKEWNIDLARSYMIGDSETDMVAGASAGCRCLFLGSRNSKLPGGESTNVCNMLAAAEVLKRVHEARE